ncbi:MAG: hypothetical protein H6831_08045 [Planctomycetes bacterium]|nr:hypothetical protein [Planctomycetota bacterium]MCB9904342.1 hypothetical protein [Planctomycetota bacterium]
MTPRIAKPHALLPVAALFVAGVAHAQDVSQLVISDQPGEDEIVLLTSAPPRLDKNSLMSDQGMMLFLERSALTPPSGMQMYLDISNSAVGDTQIVDQRSDLLLGDVEYLDPSGSYDVWYIRQELTNNASGTFTAVITFPERIVGMHTSDGRLKDYDPDIAPNYCQPGATVYPTCTGGPGSSNPGDSNWGPGADRGVEFSNTVPSLDNRIEIFPDERTIKITLTSNTKADDVRIFTTHFDPAFEYLCPGSVACPCNNDTGLESDPHAGCVNSLGKGGLLSFEGTQRIVDDNLELVMSDLPSETFGIVFMSTTPRNPVPFGAGRLCLSPGPDGPVWGSGYHRFPVQASFDSATNGVGGVIRQLDVLEMSAGMLQLSSVNDLAGTDVYFQGFYRDPEMSLCSGQRFNLTNALRVSVE